MLRAIKPRKTIDSHYAKTILYKQYGTTSSTVETLDYNSTITLPQDSTVFSLIQPTNKFHIGNYLGTMKLWRDLLNNPQVAETNSRLLFGLADLHALTKRQNPKLFKQARIEAVASIVASGIDPAKATIFTQSAVPEHSELYWILGCLTGLGYLNRMTQWKSKSQGVNTNDSVFDADVLKKTDAGVFMYPVLQAADILLYKSTLVPVGDDQAQHLELTREICQKFNRTYGNDDFRFPVPRTILAPTKKILALKDPSKKMSKSDVDQDSAIYITEEPQEIKKKIRKAVTDSFNSDIYFDPVNRPGVSNLINIVSGMQNINVQTVVENMKHSGVKSHKDLKDYVGDVVVNGLKDSKAEFEKLIGDPAYLQKIISDGNEQARSIASENMKLIKKAVGLA